MIITLGNKNSSNTNAVAKILKNRYNFKITYISRKVYISCCEVFGISFDDFGKKGDYKTTNTYKQYGMSAENLLYEYINCLLKIDKDIFSKLSDRVIDNINKNKYDNFVIPDMKRTSEYLKFKQAGAIMIKVEKNNTMRNKELDKLQWDFVITDNGDYYNIEGQVDHIMSKLGIQQIINK